MANPLQPDDAYELACRLRAVWIPEAAIPVVAAWLVKQKMDQPTAESLIMTAVESWRKWEGIAGILDLWHAAKRPENQFDQAPTAEQIEQWKQDGASHDPKFAGNILNRMTGKNSKEDWRQLRLQSIRDALEAEAAPMPFCRGGAPACQCGTCKEARNSRGFWAESLFLLRRDHPEEVAAIRAGRDPQPVPVKRAAVVPIPYNRPPAPSIVITAADVAAAPKFNIKRCDICEGTGRVTDGFCNQCDLGRELERIALKSVAARLEPDYTVGRPGDSETG